MATSFAPPGSFAEAAPAEIAPAGTGTGFGSRQSDSSARASWIQEGRVVSSEPASSAAPPLVPPSATSAMPPSAETVYAGVPSSVKSRSANRFTEVTMCSSRRPKCPCASGSGPMMIVR